MKNILLFIGSFIPALILSAQETIPLNTWRTHQTFNEVVGIEWNNSQIIAAAKEGVFSYDLTDNSLTTITSLDGIHPSEISTVGYNRESDLLFIGHASGVIDIISGNGKQQLTHLQQDYRTAKKINEFYFLENRVYVSSDLGLLIYDAAQNVFVATYDGLGNEGEDIIVNDVFIFENKIFAATEEGIIAGDLSGANLNDYREWMRFSKLPEENASSLAYYNNSLYAAFDDLGVFQYTGSEWIETGLLPGSNIKRIRSVTDALVITTEQEVYIYREGNLSVAVNELTDPDDAFIDEQGILWVAEQGLLMVHDNQLERILPSGPQVSGVNKLEVIQGQLYAMQGDLLDSGEPVFSVFQDGHWINYSEHADNDLYRLSEEFASVYDAALFEDDIYISSFGGGLLKISEDGKHYFKAGDPAVPFSSSNGQTLLTGIESSAEGLWIINYTGVGNDLYLYNGETFEQYDLQGSDYTDIFLAPNGLLLLIQPAEFKNGILVFDPATGEQNLLTDDLGLPSNEINDLVFDTDGRLWVATNSGVAYFYGGNNLLNPAADAIIPLVDNKILFFNMSVTSIAVDGGGRKWFGTEEGVWLFDDQVTEQIHHFTQENSPLLSNSVNDIILLQQTGEVFFATEEGLISYRSDASNPTLPKEEINVFPNPVRPDFNGTVGITGIAANANVKITDVNGNLIYETVANGSTASWDLHSVSGAKVLSGIYLIFTSKEDGSDSLVGKVAVLR